MEAAELRANREVLALAGMLGKLERCGPKSRPCIRVDERAGAYWGPGGSPSNLEVLAGMGVPGPKVLRSLWISAACFPLLASCLASSLESCFPGGAGLTLILLIVIALFIYMMLVSYNIVKAIASLHWKNLGVHIFLLILPLPFLWTGAKSGDYIHLLIMYPQYAKIIQDSKERPVYFSWGDTSTFTTQGMNTRTIIYDDTEKTRNNVEVIWKDDQGVSYVIKHFIGNFFIGHAHY